MIDIKQKLYMKNFKIFPLINISNSYNYKSWTILRQLCLDYGLQFFIIIEKFMEILFLAYIIVLIIFMMWAFKLYKLPKIIEYISLWDLFTIYYILLIYLIKVN